MAAPEGDYWFYHNALRSSHFEPTDPKQFYSKIWLEVASNYTIDEAWQFAPPIPWELHPRAGRQDFFGSITSTGYARYKFMTAMVGPSHDKISGYKKVHGTYSSDDVYRRSGKKMVVFVPVDMPTENDRYLWVDLTYPLRGIYFPARHIAQPKYEQFCVLSRINFTARKNFTLKSFANPRPPPPGLYEKRQIAEAMKAKGVRRSEIEAEVGKIPIPPATLPNEELHEGALTITPDRWKGLGVQPQWTLRFDVKHIMHILTLPRDWLKEEFNDPYKHMVLYDCRSVDMVAEPPGPSSLQTFLPSYLQRAQLPPAVIETRRFLAKFPHISKLADHEHGLHIAALEAGRGQVTRQNPGATTRFTFKKPFKRTPHVQLTLCNATGDHVRTEIYLLADNGPAVDPEGFNVGIFAKPGHTAEFRYLAMTILENSNESTSGTTEPKTSSTTKPKTAHP